MLPLLVSDAMLPRLKIYLFMRFNNFKSHKSNAFTVSLLAQNNFTFQFRELAKERANDLDAKPEIESQQ